MTSMTFLEKKQRFLTAMAYYDQHVGVAKPSSRFDHPDIIKAFNTLTDYRNAYLSELLFTASDLISSNIPNSTAFFVNAGGIYVRLQGNSFQSYLPKGDGGIYGALDWRELEQCMNPNELQMFRSRGISVKKVLSRTKTTVVFNEVLF